MEIGDCLHRRTPKGGAKKFLIGRLPMKKLRNLGSMDEADNKYYFRWKRLTNDIQIMGKSPRDGSTWREERHHKIIKLSEYLWKNLEIKEVPHPSLCSPLILSKFQKTVLTSKFHIFLPQTSSSLNLVTPPPRVPSRRVKLFIKSNFTREFFMGFFVLRTSLLVQDGAKKGGDGE